MNENNIIENAYNEIRGIPFGVFVGQHDRTDELNDRIFKRNIPTLELEPNFDPRPVSTKYSTLPLIDHRKEANIPIINQGCYNSEEVFYPGTTKPHYCGFATNVDKESTLRNQFFALSSVKILVI